MIAAHPQLKPLMAQNWFCSLSMVVSGAHPRWPNCLANLQVRFLLGFVAKSPPVPNMIEQIGMSHE